MLSEYTTMRVGGPAAELITAADEESFIAAVQQADADGRPVLVLGGGSNLVISDEGFPGLVVAVATKGIDEADVCGAGRVEVAAGENWDAFVARMVADGYAGVECLAGIPGQVGSTPIQNVGAYGQEVSQTIDRVRVFDRVTGGIEEWSAEDCRFGYRDSRFKQEPNRYLVLAVTFELPRSRSSRPIRYAELARSVGVSVGDRAGLADVRDEVLRLRRGKGMVLDPADHDTWSAGSFFTNPVITEEQAASLPPDAPAFPAGEGMVKTSAAWLIDNSGFGKGYGTPPATLSTKHTLALTNRGGARTEDILELARTVRDGVREATGITLEPEPMLIGCSL